MSRPKKCLVKCYLEEETMQRRMNGIFAGEREFAFSSRVEGRGLLVEGRG